MEKKTEKKKNLKNKGVPKDILQRRCQILPSLNEQERREGKRIV